MQLYGHPFSSYTQKALAALYENDSSSEFRNLSPDNPDAYAEFARRWPIRKFPCWSTANGRWWRPPYRPLFPLGTPDRD